MSDVDDRLREEVGELTGRPPADYTAARDARAKQLRAEDERDLAAAVAKARKPTLPAWAADQLAHHHGDVLDRLFAAAEEVRDRHTSGDRAGARDATRRFTAEVRRARQLAGQALERSGATPGPHLDDVEATLLAAAADDEVAADLRAGALTRPVPAPGFAALDALVAGGRSAGPRDATAPDQDEAAIRRAELEDRRRDLRDELASQQARRDEATATAAAAHDETERLRARAEEAASRAAGLDRDRRRLDDTVAGLRRELADVEAELDA